MPAAIAANRDRRAFWLRPDGAAGPLPQGAVFSVPRCSPLLGGLLSCFAVCSPLLGGLLRCISARILLDPPVVAPRARCRSCGRSWLAAVRPAFPHFVSPAPAPILWGCLFWCFFPPSQCAPPGLPASPLGSSQTQPILWGCLFWCFFLWFFFCFFTKCRNPFLVSFLVLLLLFSGGVNAPPTYGRSYIKQDRL